MGLIQAPYAPLLLFERLSEDADGNKTYTSLGNISACVDLIGQGLESRAGGSRAQGGGVVAVPRGTDVKVGDRFTYGGQHYMLATGPDGDQVHPFTGDDFGWMTFTFIGQIARWGGG